MKDTCNLLADGIVKLLRVLAAVAKTTDREWSKARGYGRYLASSIKGEAAIDWSERTALLAGIVGDADRLLELSRQAQGELPEDSDERQRIVAAAELLGQLLLQDDENPMTRALDRVGTGLLLQGHKSCDPLKLEVRRCEAWAASASTVSGSYTLAITLAVLLGNERAAERHVADFEDHLKKVQESVDSLEYEVDTEGEFIEVKASVDIDDLGHCDFLDALPGNECLIAAKAPPPQPRFTLGVQKPVETEVSIMAVSSMARNNGKMLTI